MLSWYHALSSGIARPCYLSSGCHALDGRGWPETRPQQAHSVRLRRIRCWALAAGVSLTAIRVADLSRWRERFLVWLTDGGSSLLQQTSVAQ